MVAPWLRTAVVCEIAEARRMTARVGGELFATIAATTNRLREGLPESHCHGPDIKWALTPCNSIESESARAA